MHVACMVVTACNLLSPVVDIFYLIFTLMITVLVCLMYMGKKKIVPGLCTHAFTRPRYHPRPPGGLQLPPSPQLQSFLAIVFGFTKSRCTYIFSVLSPGPIGNSLSHTQQFIYVLCILNNPLITLFKI